MGLTRPATRFAAQPGAASAVDLAAVPWVFPITRTRTAASTVSLATKATAPTPDLPRVSSPVGLSEVVPYHTLCLFVSDSLVIL